MIYSENAPIIRDDRGCLLENPMYCNFITCPAVNKTLARFIMPSIKTVETEITEVKKNPGTSESVRIFVWNRCYKPFFNWYCIH
mgnify:FL=1